MLEAASRHLAAGTSLPRPIDFKAVVLTAAFSDLPTLLKSYRIGGMIPILAPLRLYPRIQRWFQAQTIDTWMTKSRIAALVRAAKARVDGRLRLHLLHAINDLEISYRNSEELFHVAANASSAMAIDAWEFESKKNRSLRMRGPGKMEWVDIGEGKEVVLDVQGAGGEFKDIVYRFQAS